MAVAAALGLSLAVAQTARRSPPVSSWIGIQRTPRGTVLRDGPGFGFASLVSESGLTSLNLLVLVNYVANTAVTWPGRLRQIHSFFRNRSPGQMLARRRALDQPRVTSRTSGMPL